MNRDDDYQIKDGSKIVFLPKSQAMSPGKALDMLLADPGLILYGLMKDQQEDVWKYKSCQNKSILFQTDNVHNPWCACLMELFVLDVFYTEEQYYYYRQFSY